MPKPLFYTGVLCTILFAVGCGAAALDLFRSDAGGLEAGRDRAVLASLTMLLFTVPVAALFLRMASLLAARNLFASFLALFSISCTSLALAGVSLLRLRNSVTAGRGPELEQGGYLLLGWFLSVSFLVLRPYFKGQASRLISSLVFFPLPLFCWILLQTPIEVFTAGVATPDSSPLFLFLVVVAALFFAVALHSTRHRHLFLEVTNLRELLDARVDPGSHGHRGPAGFRGDVVYER